ncbi:MAG: hypothetical protein JXL80_05810 [Planctomycetes bacterium]|nr:hypothetical protein [Planctomycetota bacterium]
MKQYVQTPGLNAQWGPDMGPLTPVAAGSQLYAQYESHSNVFIQGVPPGALLQPSLQLPGWQPQQMYHLPSGWAENEMTAEEVFEQTSHSWYDFPGIDYTPGQAGTGKKAEWWFYVEIWRHCKGAAGDAKIDAAHFAGKLFVRDTADGPKAKAYFKGPVWL